jgi:hypothetical protein
MSDLPDGAKPQAPIVLLFPDLVVAKAVHDVSQLGA